MSASNRTDRFYGAFDPKIPGNIYLRAAKDRFSPSYQQEAHRKRLAWSRDWSDRDLDFILFESAYVHEAMHMLQYYCTPVLSRVLSYRMAINATGAGLLHEMRESSRELSRGSGRAYLPVPLTRWVFTNEGVGAAMVREALEELEYLGGLPPGETKPWPFFVQAWPDDTGGDVLQAHERLISRHAVLRGNGPVALDRQLGLVAIEYAKLGAVLSHRDVFVAAELSAIAMQLAFVARGFGPKAMRVVARSLLSAGMYQEIEAFLERIVAIAEPEPERLVMASCAGFWSLLSPATDDDRALAETTERLALVAATDFAAGPVRKPSETFRMFDGRIGGDFRSAILETSDRLALRCKAVDDFNNEHLGFLQMRTRDFISSYATTAFDSSHGFCQSIQNTDDMLSLDNIVALTHYVTKSLPIFYLKQEPHEYTSLSKWLKAFEFSYSGIPSKFAEMVVGGYQMASALDALFLGDEVNIVPAGADAIRAMASASMVLLRV